MLEIAADAKFLARPVMEIVASDAVLRVPFPRLLMSLAWPLARSCAIKPSLPEMRGAFTRILALPRGIKISTPILKFSYFSLGSSPREHLSSAAGRKN